MTEAKREYDLNYSREYREKNVDKIRLRRKALYQKRVELLKANPITRPKAKIYMNSKSDETASFKGSYIFAEVLRRKDNIYTVRAIKDHIEHPDSYLEQSNCKILNIRRAVVFNRRLIKEIEL